MAAGRKEYELLFKLKAALGGDFNSTFTTAMNTTKQLQNTISTINSLSGKIDGYKKQADAIEKSKVKLAELNAEHGKLQQEMSQTENPSESLRKKFEKNARQIAETTARIEEQERRLGTLGQELRSAGVNTYNLEAANGKLAKSYEEVKKSQEDLAKLSAERQKTAEAISKTKAELAGTIGVITALGAVTYAGAIKPAIEFESAIAGVKKTINGTPEELLKIQNGIRKMATEIPLSVKEIAAISEAAGQLGIKTESILGFTRTMADLGVTTNLAGEEAASTLAKFANITGMSQSNFDRLGSTIVALGNNLATTESDIAAMGLRLAGAGKQVGLSEAQILAFSGALSSVGIEAEAGGSAFSKVMVDMQLAVETGNKDLANFSRVAGMSATEFKKAFQTDAAGAINTFIKGLGKSKEKGESAIKILDDMGITEVRMRDALLRAAGANDVFTQSITLGTQAWKENVALTEEAKKRYETTESSIKLMKQAFNDIGISLGSVFLPHLAKTAKHVSVLAQKFSEFAQKNPELITTVTKVVAGLLAFKVATLGVKLAFLDIKQGVNAVQTVMALFRGKTAAAGVEAIGLTSKLKTAGGGIKSYFGGIKGALGGLGGAIGNVFGGGKIAKVFSGVGNLITAPFTKVFGGLGGKLLGTFGGVGGKIASIFGSVGGKILTGPLGKIGGMIIKPFASIGKLLGPLANLGGAILGPFSGIFGKIFPVVGVIMLIKSAIQILRDHLDDVRNFIEKIFGKAGVEVFDKVVAAVTNIGNVIKNIFNDGNLGGARNFIQNMFGEKGVAVFDGIITILRTVWGVIGQFVAFVDANVKPVLESLFTFIVGTVLPMIAQKFAEWAPTIASIIQGLWTVIQAVATQVMNVISFAMPIIQSVITGALHSIMGVIGGLLTVLKGVIDFVAGVFTGDWERVWLGVKNIFKGIFDSLAGILKAPINAVISIINGVVKSINNVGFKIPDWVPFGLGGKDFKINIPEIPMFAKGSNHTPSTFIAGEQGPELITNAPGRTVYTAQETQTILNIIERVKTLDIQSLIGGGRMVPAFAGAGGITLNGGYGTPVTVRAGAARNMGGMAFTINNNIKVDGAAPNDLDEKLQRNNLRVVQMVKDELDKEKRDHYRTVYQ